MARVRPHFKVHVSIRTHEKTSNMVQDDKLLVTYIRLGTFMVERHAANTNDTVLVTLTELLWITNTRRLDAALQVLHELQARAPIPAGLLAEVGTKSSRFPFANPRTGTR